jgi:hypothetical protein
MLAAPRHLDRTAAGLHRPAAADAARSDLARDPTTPGGCEKGVGTSVRGREPGADGSQIPGREKKCRHGTQLESNPSAGLGDRLRDSLKGAHLDLRQRDENFRLRPINEDSSKLTNLALKFSVTYSLLASQKPKIP